VTESPCPCGSDTLYSACCGRFHAGGIPETAEQLMRSRYSAYVLELRDYLLATWHPSTRPADLDLGDAPQTRWLGLKITSTMAGGPDDAQGTVAFVARCKIGGRAHRMEETSRFVREQGRWWYLDGDVRRA
jgi:SEC-C motif domain protein